MDEEDQARKSQSSNYQIINEQMYQYEQVHDLLNKNIKILSKTVTPIKQIKKTQFKNLLVNQQQHENFIQQRKDKYTKNTEPVSQVPIRSEQSSLGASFNFQTSKKSQKSSSIISGQTNIKQKQIDLQNELLSDSTLAKVMSPDQLYIDKQKQFVKSLAGSGFSYNQEQMFAALTNIQMQEQQLAQKNSTDLDKKPSLTQQQIIDIIDQQIANQRYNIKICNHKDMRFGPVASPKTPSQIKVQQQIASYQYEGLIPANFKQIELDKQPLWRQEGTPGCSKKEILQKNEIVYGYQPSINHKKGYVLKQAMALGGYKTRSFTPNAENQSSLKSSRSSNVSSRHQKSNKKTKSIKSQKSKEEQTENYEELSILEQFLRKERKNREKYLIRKDAQHVIDLIDDILDKKQNKQPSLVVEVLKNKKEDGCVCMIKDYVKEYIRHVRNMPSNFTKIHENFKNQSGKFRPCVHDLHKDEKAERQLLIMTWFEDLSKQIKIQNRDQDQKIERTALFESFVQLISQSQELDPFVQGLQKFIKDQKFVSRRSKGLLDYSDFFRFNKFMSLKKKKKFRVLKTNFDVITSSDSSRTSSLNEQEIDSISQPLQAINLFEDSQESPQNKSIKLNLDIQKQVRLDKMKKEYLNVYQPSLIDGRNIIQKESSIQRSVSSKSNSDKSSFSNLQEKTFQSLDIISNQKIILSEKMYKNFVSRLSNKTNVSFNKELQDEDQKFSKKALEKSLIESLKQTVNTLKELKRLREEREQQRLKMTRLNIDEVVVPINKNLHYLKQELVKQIEQKQYTIEQQANAFNQQLSKKREKFTLQKDKIRMSQEALAQPIVSQRKLSKQSSITQAIFQKHTGEEIQKTFQNKKDSLLFYQQAKNKTNNADDNFHKQHQISFQFLNDLQIQNVMPKPYYVNAINNRQMTITGLIHNFSKEVALAFKNLLISAEKQNLEQYKIQKLLIDDASVSDEAIAILLEGFLGQHGCFSSLVFMNCKLGKKSTEQILNILQKKGIQKLEELRFVNVKGFEVPGEQLNLILDSILNGNTLMTLQISNQDFISNDRVELLCEIIMQNTKLQDLYLNHLRITLKQFNKITNALKFNTKLRSISLRGINIFNLATDTEYTDHLMINGKKSKLMNLAIQDLCECINLSNNINHLDLSQMSLGKYALVLAKNAFKQNQSLLSIHLSNNNLSMLQIEELLTLMDVDFTKLKQRIKDHLSFSHGEDVLEKKGDPYSYINYLTQQQSENFETGLLTNKLISELNISEQFKEFEGLSPNKKQNPIDDDNKDQIISYIEQDVLKEIKQEMKQKETIVQYGNLRTNQDQIGNKLVLQRKFTSLKQLSSAIIQQQIQDNTNYQHFDMSKLVYQGWYARMSDHQCYMCNNYKMTTLYYRRSDQSKPNSYFTKITDQNEIQKLQLIINQKFNDIYNNLPIVFSSMFDYEQKSLRMINVKHIAALVYGIKEINKLKGNNSMAIQQQKREALLRKYVKAVQKMMQDGMKEQFENEKELKESSEIKQIYDFFADWREGQEFLEQNLKDQNILNYPIFDNMHTKEDDIYTLSTYMRPGNHSIIIYDPKLQQFFKRQNIVIQPRNGDKEVVEFEESFIQTFKKENQEAGDLTMEILAQMEGSNFKISQNNIFGQLIEDLTPQTSSAFYYQDFDQFWGQKEYSFEKMTPKLASLYRFLQTQSRDPLIPIKVSELPVTPQILSKMKDLIKQNYELIGKLWRLIKVLIDFCSLNNSNANFEVDILASALGTIFEWSELNKKFKSQFKQKSEFEIFQIVSKQIQETVSSQFLKNEDQFEMALPVFIKQLIQAEVEQDGRKTIQHFEMSYEDAVQESRNQINQESDQVLQFQRRMIPLVLLRISCLFNAIGKEDGPLINLQLFLSAISKFINQSDVDQLQSNKPSKYNLSYLRNHLIFSNKPLVILLKINTSFVKKFLFDQYFTNVGFSMQQQELQSLNIHNGYFSLGQNQDTKSSLQQFWLFLQQIKIENQENLVTVDSLVTKKQSMISSTSIFEKTHPSYQLLRAMALQSKISIFAQELEDTEIKKNSLTFQEFQLFLTLVSLYLDNQEFRKHCLEIESIARNFSQQTNYKCDFSIINPLFLSNLIDFTSTGILLTYGQSIKKIGNLRLALNFQQFLLAIEQQLTNTKTNLGDQKVITINDQVFRNQADKNNSSQTLDGKGDNKSMFTSTGRLKKDDSSDYSDGYNH